MAAEYDEQCPADKVREAAAQAHDAKLSLHYNTHFDMYLGETFQVSCRRIWCPFGTNGERNKLSLGHVLCAGDMPHRGNLGIFHAQGGAS